MKGNKKTTKKALLNGRNGTTTAVYLKFTKKKCSSKLNLFLIVL